MSQRFGECMLRGLEFIFISIRPPVIALYDQTIPSYKYVHIYIYTDYFQYIESKFILKNN